MAPRPARKAHRELAAELAVHGFAFVGTNGAGHLVFRHAIGGRAIHLPATPRVPARWRANAVALARRLAAADRPGPRP